MNRFLKVLPFLVFFGALSHAPPAPAQQPARVVLTSEGRAAMPVIVGRNASARIRSIARTLADHLQRISGAAFEVTTGDGLKGLAVGVPADFPALELDRKLDARGLERREQYLLRSHSAGLHVVGATELAVEDAVWDLLYRLGYRQFFPGPTWEVVPTEPDISVALDVKEAPSYYARGMFYGHGFWDYNEEPFRQWQSRNRRPGAFILQTGHAYQKIVSRNRAAFDAHPEYLGLVNGERRSDKFCISNPGLRRLVVEDALETLRRHPEYDSVSVEPSDHAGWCECAQCAALGSVSDRVQLLANAVAEALEASMPDKYAAHYAYYLHSPPPAIRVHPGVIVVAATAFIKGGYTIDQILEGWARAGTRLFGVREYYGVMSWDHDLPAASHAGDLDYIARTIPRFYRLGARFFVAESSDNWGPNGLGYYVSSRLLWDIEEADDVEKIVDDFLDKAFGPARAPMKKFYALIAGGGKPAVSKDMIRLMYGLLKEARQSTSDPRVMERLDDLVLYTRHVELYRAYKKTPFFGRQAAFEALMRHAYRMRKRMMVHTKGLYKSLTRRDKRIVVPPEAGIEVPESRNPWMAGGDYRREEIEVILSRGLEAEAP